MKSFTVSTDRLRQFRQRLVRWYGQHGRDLPWRKTADPYRILLAEVMLQQTQVDRVISRYEHWLQRWPNIRSLAQASRRDVLQEWSGLGYNRRALAVQRSAQKIMEQHHGRFPRDPATMMTLPGVGKYTAHAIAAFAFRAPVPLVDTNIKRVLGRVFFGFETLAKLRDTDEPFWELSWKLIHSSRSAYAINQSLMDLGALVCIAKQPRCQSCPMRTICRSYPKILTAQAAVLRVKTQRVEKKYFGQPRRIWRGQILRYLHTQPQGATTITTIGHAIQTDWTQQRLPWLKTVLASLEKDGLVRCRGHRIRLP